MLLFAEPIAITDRTLQGVKHQDPHHISECVLFGAEPVFADADVFVLPSRYENFANAAAEAIASGVPVVITEACGIRSLISGRAGIVIAPEKRDLTAALRRILSDHELYSQFKTGCREVAAQLSWDRLTQQMEGHYIDILRQTNEHY